MVSKVICQGNFRTETVHLSSGNTIITDAPLDNEGKGEDGHLETKVMTSDGFIQYARPFLDGEGFYEYEIFRKVEEFGHVAHIWSTYGSKRSKDDFEPYTRGINSIQLLNDQKRWWVISIYWNRETDEFQIPEKYLGNGDI